ncbi:MAG: hypothetical protein LC777_01680 [Actinobacteria bacterium]|nr:hypothetical protein [Actinomycetota bacterium]
MQRFVDECAAFPKGAHDDQVDAFSQAMARLQGGAPTRAFKESGRPETAGLKTREL